VKVYWSGYKHKRFSLMRGDVEGSRCAAHIVHALEKKKARRVLMWFSLLLHVPVDVCKRYRGPNLFLIEPSWGLDCSMTSSPSGSPSPLFSSSGHRHDCLAVIIIMTCKCIRTNSSCPHCAGGSGFLGQHLVAQLLATGHYDVRVFDVRDNGSSSVPVIVGDLRKHDQVRFLLKHLGTQCCTSALRLAWACLEGRLRLLPACLLWACAVHAPPA